MHILARVRTLKSPHFTGEPRQLLTLFTVIRGRHTVSLSNGISFRPTAFYSRVHKCDRRTDGQTTLR